ncbi:hypothetical protein MLD38_003426 [Melastoma candidum]|uniref:Uncharacterized protein n=1 Tax=Melastoma candidum TaxID=119954 RepID=A0ACB9S2N4_9MYRT|nr:hypothetical protein MLD38_003426 [Melastoma candidum]
MAAVLVTDSDVLVNGALALSLQDQGETVTATGGCAGGGCDDHGGICAICLDKIVLQDTALVKGCEHTYCVTCILRWASCKENPTCPQCKHPFNFLNVHRSLDGSIHDYMFEESVCLLLRASWFNPLAVHYEESPYDDTEEYNPYYEEDDDEDDINEVYFNSPNVRIGNRRWGDNGYVRAGRQEARPVYRFQHQEDSGGASSSRPAKKKDPPKETTGRRAKRAMKREAADKAAAAKHQQHLVRLGRK